MTDPTTLDQQSAAASANHNAVAFSSTGHYHGRESATFGSESSNHIAQPLSSRAARDPRGQIQHLAAERRYRKTLNDGIQDLHGTISAVMTEDSETHQVHVLAQPSTKSSTLASGTALIYQLRDRLAHAQEHNRLLQMKQQVVGSQVKCDACPAVASLSNTPLAATHNPWIAQPRSLDEDTPMTSREG